MPEPPGEIYWSARAQRFYQEGHRGAVSRETAIPSLRYDDDAGRFRDQKGRLIDNELLNPTDRHVQRITGLDAQGRPFIRTVLTDNKLEEAAARNETLAGNEQIIVRIVAKLPDGSAVIGEASSKLGKGFSLDHLVEQAKRNARGKAGDVGTGVDTPYIGANTLNVSYIKRRVAIS
jgi:hypothetical protein